MGKRSFFGLEPDQLDQLLSLGTEAGDGANAAEPAPGPPDESNAPEALAEVLSVPTLDAPFEYVGSCVGPYRLVRVLGEGGMGTVYLADQTAPIRRRVALKVIKPGMDSKRVVARFEAERQALALLDHPNIAHVYDAGTTGGGRLYFVMEYVKGLPITEYCDRHTLDIEARLRLFQQVCHGVQHAHQKGIIHRDIKPSNIVVTTEGDEAIPKIIDFGVAKAISQPLTERTLVTEDNHLLGTPEYMSPEQADMANEDVDTRSDIYSLGVLLYVLLAGILPYDSETFRQGGIEHIRRTIRETDPKTPSTRLTKLGQEARKLAESRRTELAALAKCLHRELEWIPLKAMRKDRAERYRSASELADDIENYLKGEPLIAGPPGTGYKLNKFIRRNRVLVGGIAAVLVVLVAGVVVSTVFAFGQARARAEAQAVADFFQSGIEGLTLPGQVEGTEVSLQDLLTVWSKKLEGRFDDKPLIEASIRDTLGWAYRYIYELKAADLHLELALQIRRQQLGAGHPQTLSCADRLAWLRWDQGRYQEAAELLEQALSVSRRALGDDDRVMLSLNNALGCVYGMLGRDEEAEQVYVNGLRTARQAWGDKAAITRSMTANLGGIYRAQGRYREAEDQYLRWFELSEGEADEETGALVWKGFLGAVYLDQGQYQKAKQLYLEILPIQRRKIGSEHWHTLRSASWLAQVHIHLGEYPEADALLKEVLATRERRLDEDHPTTLGTINALGVLRREQGQDTEAESLFHQALAGRQRRLGPDHPACFESMHELAVLYMQQARWGDAEPLLLEAFHGREVKLGPEHPHTIESLKQLVSLYESWPQPDEAVKWRAKLPPKEIIEE
ncbi:tetratricopeptide repeat protein [Anaerobaca lacustris]|uniref:Tetratricopeptide repeat protein n=1 Tax=Anaerobaca lacustris TaxID=3044600 RepID=A0AAW6U0N5_9BACT|nr:tetratricopeptide repeat protein [Sedimentisphaerales bacterium M17dextr]